MANATLQASDPMALLYLLCSHLERGTTISRRSDFKPGDAVLSNHPGGGWVASVHFAGPVVTPAKGAGAEKPKDTRRWLANEVGYFVGEDSHRAATFHYGDRVVVKCYDPLAPDCLLVCSPDKMDDVPLHVWACDVVREQPAELDPQGEIVPFPAKPSQPQWEVQFVGGDGVLPAGWEPFAVTDRHIALRRRVQ